MNTTPLIDVMLVLLIMFIITIPVMTHGVHLDLPHGPAPLAQERPPVVELGVDFDGVVTWNGAAVSDMPALERYLQSSSAESPQPEIHLRPDRRARCGVGCAGAGRHSAPSPEADRVREQREFRD